jgi:hypothetical protein
MFHSERQYHHEISGKDAQNGSKRLPKIVPISARQLEA